MGVQDHGIKLHRHLIAAAVSAEAAVATSDATATAAATAAVAVAAASCRGYGQALIPKRTDHSSWPCQARGTLALSGTNICLRCVHDIAVGAGGRIAGQIMIRVRYCQSWSVVRSIIVQKYFPEVLSLAC